MFVESGAEGHVPEKHSYRKEAMEKQEQAARKGKHLWMILICNLFLTTTVILFQPFEHLLADFRSSAEPVWRIWWVQLLLAAGITGIISMLMLLLPRKAEKIAALISLGLGISFLIQSLLFNNGWPFDMNTTWEMKVGCVLIWIWIVLFVVTTTYYFFEKNEKRTEVGVIATAWLLIVIQAVNLTVLSTSYDMLAREPGYLREKQYQQYIQPKEMDLVSLEEKLLNASMYRGMPFLIKDSFRTTAGQIKDVSSE